MKWTLKCRWHYEIRPVHNNTTVTFSTTIRLLRRSFLQRLRDSWPAPRRLVSGPFERREVVSIGVVRYRISPSSRPPRTIFG